MLGGIGDLGLLTGLMRLGVAPLLLTGMDTDLLFSAARGALPLTEMAVRARDADMTIRHIE